MEFKTERISEWVERWDDFQWNSKEWREYLLSLLRAGEEVRDKLDKIEPLYEKQAEYIKYLERQLELLQKTLDIAERFSRPIILPGDSGVVK